MTHEGTRRRTIDIEVWMISSISFKPNADVLHTDKLSWEDKGEYADGEQRADVNLRDLRFN
jgi:hypothetical protein